MSAAFYPQVQEIYIAYYGRPADPAGLQYWAGQLAANRGNLSAIINAFGSSAESTALYAGADNSAKVTAIYRQLFNRAPDTAGLNFYTDALSKGTMTAASIALNVADGASGVDLTYLNNKMTVAQAFTDALTTDSAANLAYAGTTAATSARSLITGVTTSAATTAVASTISSIKSGGGAVAGQTFTLTTGVDAPALTAGNDTITAASGTLNSTDVIVDASSTDNDTLNAVITASNPGTSAPVIVNVENINADFKGFGVALNAASITSGTVTASTTQDGNSAATISNLSSTVKVVAGAGVTTLNLTGTNTTLRMAGQSLTSGATTNMSESLGIESNGTAANTLTLTAGQTIAKAVVTGSQSLTLKGGLPLVTAKTVSKSLTGNATLTYEVNATMSATADLTNVKADVVDLNVASAMGTYGLTLQSGSTVKLSKNVADMGTGGLIANTTGVTNTSADTLNINLAASQAGVTTSGFETVNLAVNSTSATISTGVFTTSGDVVVTGSNDLTISTLTSVRTLDASSLNGKLTVSALGTVAMTVAGGAGNDTVTFAEGTNNQTITTGAGVDTVNIEITAGATIADTIVAGSGDDTVNLTATTGAISHSSAPTMTAAVLNGGAGTDTLNLGTTSAQFLTVTNSAAGTLTLNGVTNFENINVFIHATGVSAAHTNAVSLVTVDDNVSAGGTLNLGVKITDGGTAASYAKTYTINGGAEKDGSLNISITQLGTQYGTYSTFTITGGDLGDTISGGKGIDTITGGKGVDSIFLAAGGNDVVVVAGGDTGLTQATADVINGANAGDTIDFTNVTATIGATAADLGTGWSVSSGVASKSGSTLAEFITAVVAKGAAGSVNGITSTAYAYASGTDLYIYAAGANASASSDDILVLIVGGSGNTLTASSGDIVLV